MPRSIVIAMLVIALSASAAGAAAGGEEVEEYAVKAAFLYKFALFVTWPLGTFDGADEPLVIAVLGENPFGDNLERGIAGKKVQGHPVRIAYRERAEDLEGCHVVFVAGSFAGHAGTLPATLHRHGLLTVGDQPHFARRGGMISLKQEDGRMAIEICERAIREAGLAVSSRLLGLAELVPCRE